MINNEKKKYGLFKKDFNKSWDAYKKYGARNHNSEMGLALRKETSELSKKLGRKLEENEIKQLYKKVGKWGLNE